MTTTRQQNVAAAIGRAIAKDTLADGYPVEWTGLDAQDGDLLLLEGIDHGSQEWDECERIAREAYAAAVAE